VVMMGGQGKSLIESLVEKERSWKGWLWFGAVLYTLVGYQYFSGVAIELHARPFGYDLIESAEKSEFRNELIFQAMVILVLIILPSLYARKIERDFYSGLKDETSENT
jgi:hypothetical protein